MLRGSLLSVLTIAVVVFVIGAATFAPFSDTGDATGDVTAGTLIIAINGDETPDPATMTFNTEDYCPDNMAVGDTCIAEVVITNVGSLAGSISISNIDAWISSISGAGDACTIQEEEPDEQADGFHWTAFVGESYSDETLGEEPDLLLPQSVQNDSTTIQVFVHLNEFAGSEEFLEGVDDCQGSTVTVTVRVHLEQAPDPHTTVDEFEGEP